MQFLLIVLSMSFIYSQAEPQEVPAERYVPYKCSGGERTGYSRWLSKLKKDAQQAMDSEKDKSSCLYRIYAKTLNALEVDLEDPRAPYCEYINEFCGNPWIDKELIKTIKAEGCQDVMKIVIDLNECKTLLGKNNAITPVYCKYQENKLPTGPQRCPCNYYWCEIPAKKHIVVIEADRNVGKYMPIQELPYKINGVYANE